jgi:hypothetical protein
MYCSKKIFSISLVGAGMLMALNAKAQTSTPENPPATLPLSDTPAERIAENSTQPEAPIMGTEGGASVTTVTTTTATAEADSMRIGARLGRDRYMSREKNYFAAGAEVGMVSNLFTGTMARPMRGEFGIVGVAMNDQDPINAAAVHAFAGPAARISSGVVGARLLVGGVWDSTEKWRADGGGEMRFGYEQNDVSIFAGVGRTNRTTRVGIDLGLTL